MKPILYTQVLDHEEMFFLITQPLRNMKPLKDPTAYLLTSAMEDVVNGAGGTGGSAEDEQHAC